MIGGFLIAIAILAIASWFIIMLVWWQEERAKKEARLEEITLVYYEKISRFARRGWYACERYSSQIGVWIGEKAQKVFFRIFPDARDAFSKKDPLAGLHHGPSSFFLLSISETKKVPSKKNTTKKLLSQ